ncbi:hypothetical protein MMC28_001878 [Mycoblastus sanguinarius]|nr:hypothetical protein [Mycoblastus sanguinarius]
MTERLQKRGRSCDTFQIQANKPRELCEVGRGSGVTIELQERVTSITEDGATDTLSENRLTEPNTDANPAMATSYSKRLRIWWSHNVSTVVEHTSQGLTGGDPRDYLALERTFLGWIRTSVALVSFGVVITQLFILHKVDPTKGIILGAIISFGGILGVVLGCERYFRHQRLLVKGKALSGGWHGPAMLLLLVGLLLTLFVIVLVEI